MPNKVQLIVYSLENCPHCEQLKEYLNKGGYSFVERDLSTAESLTELRVNGVFVNEAPVLQQNDEFYTSDDLFSGGKLNSDRIAKIAKGE